MMRSRSFWAARLTTSAALGPSPLMRMSSGTILAERKAALGLVELHGRNADVEHHAVGRFHAVLAGNLVQIGEFAAHDQEPVAPARHHFLARGDCRRIAVDGDHIGACLQDRLAVAAGAESAVDDCGAGARRQCGKDLVEQYRNMTHRSASNAFA